MTEQPGTLLIGATIVFIMGIIMVQLHNIWVADWQVVITLLCWWTMIKGIIGLNMSSLAKKSVHLTSGKAIYAMIALLNI